MSRHAWPPKEEWHSITAHESPDGNERIVRQCLACALVKETVIAPHANGAWHEWITRSGSVWVGEQTPPCIESGEPVEMKFS